MTSSSKTAISSSEGSRSPSPDLTDPIVLRNSLHAASRKGDSAQLDTILRRWTSTHPLYPPSQDDLERALGNAVLYGHLAVVKLLLEHGAPITSTTATMATRDDKPNVLAIFEAFVLHGWDVRTTTDSRDQTMVMDLIMGNAESESLLRLFLDNGAPPNGLAPSLSSPIRRAVLSAKSPAIPSLLISRGANLQHTSALHAAAYRRDEDASIAMMKSLLEAGIDIDELEFQGWDDLPREAANMDWGTALHIAAETKGSMKKARFLVEKGADVGKKSKNDFTARDWAQIDGREDTRQYLEAIMTERSMEFKQVKIKEEDEDESEDED